MNTNIAYMRIAAMAVLLAGWKAVTGRLILPCRRNRRQRRLHKAIQVYVAADVLWKQLRPALDAWQLGNQLTEDQELALRLRGPFAMLAGMAIEAMRKGAILQALPPAERDFLRTHKLVVLSGRAGIQWTDTQLDLLRRLTTFIEWAGRYSVGLSEQWTNEPRRSSFRGALVPVLRLAQKKLGGLDRYRCVDSSTRAVSMMIGTLPPAARAGRRPGRRGPAGAVEHREVGAAVAGEGRRTPKRITQRARRLSPERESAGFPRAEPAVFAPEPHGRLHLDAAVSRGGCEPRPPHVEKRDFSPIAALDAT
jgi:hypothetical protein